MMRVAWALAKLEVIYSYTPSNNMNVSIIQDLSGKGAWAMATAGCSLAS